MRFETISLLLNWLEMGALLAILFRLSHTFELIASTQRELRRAIHHVGERRITELGSPHARSSAESTTGPHALANSRLSSTVEHLPPPLPQAGGEGVCITGS
jgi:hypothetical protein